MTERQHCRADNLRQMAGGRRCRADNLRWQAGGRRCRADDLRWQGGRRQPDEGWRAGALLVWQARRATALPHWLRPRCSPAEMVAAIKSLARYFLYAGPPVHLRVEMQEHLRAEAFVWRDAGLPRYALLF